MSGGGSESKPKCTRIWRTPRLSKRYLPLSRQLIEQKCRDRGPPLVAAWPFDCRSLRAKQGPSHGLALHPASGPGRLPVPVPVLQYLFSPYGEILGCHCVVLAKELVKRPDLPLCDRIPGFPLSLDFKLPFSGRCIDKCGFPQLGKRRHMPRQVLTHE